MIICLLKISNLNSLRHLLPFPNRSNFFLNNPADRRRNNIALPVSLQILNKINVIQPAIRQRPANLHPFGQFLQCLLVKGCPFGAPRFLGIGPAFSSFPGVVFRFGLKSSVRYSLICCFNRRFSSSMSFTFFFSRSLSFSSRFICRSFSPDELSFPWPEVSSLSFKFASQSQGMITQ